MLLRFSMRSDISVERIVREKNNQWRPAVRETWYGVLTMAKQWKRGELNGLALLAAGFMLVGMSAGGTLLGFLLGRLFAAEILGAVIGLLLGTLIGLYDLYLLAMRIFSQQATPGPEEQQRAREAWEQSALAENDGEEKKDRDINHEL